MAKRAPPRVSPEAFDGNTLIRIVGVKADDPALLRMLDDLGGKLVHGEAKLKAHGFIVFLTNDRVKTIRIEVRREYCDPFKGKLPYGLTSSTRRDEAIAMLPGGTMEQDDTLYNVTIEAVEVALRFSTRGLLKLVWLELAA